MGYQVLGRMNSAWYLATSEVNTNLAWGHFRQDGKVEASLDFWRKLAHECLVNLIGIDKDNEYVGSIPLRTCRMHKKLHSGSQRLQNIAGYGFPSKKMEQSQKKYRKQRCMNYPECKNRVRIFVYATGGCFFVINASWNTKLV